MVVTGPIIAAVVLSALGIGGLSELLVKLTRPQRRHDLRNLNPQANLFKGLDSSQMRQLEYMSHMNFEPAEKLVHTLPLDQQSSIKEKRKLINKWEENDPRSFLDYNLAWIAGDYEKARKAIATSVELRALNKTDAYLLQSGFDRDVMPILSDPLVRDKSPIERLELLNEFISVYSQMET